MAMQTEVSRISEPVQATEPGAAPERSAQAQMNGMGGMMGGNPGPVRSANLLPIFAGSSIHVLEPMRGHRQYRANTPYFW